MLPTADILIKNCRRASGLSQAKVAKKMGAHPAQISTWEQGIHEPSFNNVVDCLAAMGFRLKLARLDDE